MMVCAVEKVGTAGNENKGIDKSGCIAGSARIAVLASAAAEDLVGFIRSNVKPGTLIVSDALKDRAALDEYRHRSMMQDAGVDPGADMPIVHKLFGNIKA